MAGENFQAQDDFGQVQRVKSLTTSTAVTTYAAKTGRAADDFIIDRVIRVNTASESNMAISLPDGVYYGQKLTIIHEVLGGSATVGVTPDGNGDNGTSLTAAGGYNRYEWMGSTIGWTLTDSSGT